MDLNLVVLKGRPVTEPEIVEFPDGVRFMRMLIAVRSEYPQQQLDVLAVIWWNPPEQSGGNRLEPRRATWVVGAMQRRFLDVSDPPRSHVEVVAHAVMSDLAQAGAMGAIAP